MAAGFAVLAMAGLAAPARAAVGAAADPLALTSASLRIVNGRIVWRLRTTAAWRAHTLATHGRSLCLQLAAQAPSHRRSRVCVARTGPSGLRLLLTPLTPAAPTRRVHATIARPDPRTLVARFTPHAVRLAPSTVRWRTVSTWSPGDDCPPAAPALHARCVSRAPPGGQPKLTIPPPPPRGCVPSGASYRTNGPTNRRVIALTFDDGPGVSTPGVLSALERARVVATFFIVGVHIAGHEADMRRALADGDALGDHTFHHARVDGGGAFAVQEITSTARLITGATGYRPCLFRAPYGSTSPALIGLAAGLGMATIQWNVDPRDWSLPGTDSIVANVLANARPGAIVIMHDGGGVRAQTAAAIPHIVAGLRARGYRFATVPDLLGFRPVR